MIKTPLHVALDELDRCREEPWFGRFASPEEFERAYPHKALHMAELINELIRRAREIMRESKGNGQRSN